MNDSRLSTERVFNPLIEYDAPMFNFNTTIVDLKPFDREKTLDPIEKTYRLNKIETLEPFESLTNVQNQKKYLISKNLNFYEPVKDAEMLVQLGSLRLRLKTQKAPNIEYNESVKKLSKSAFSINNYNKMNNKYQLQKTSCLNNANELNDSSKNCLECNNQKVNLVHSHLEKSMDTDKFSLKSYNLNNSITTNLNNNIFKPPKSHSHDDNFEENSNARLNCTEFDEFEEKNGAFGISFENLNSAAPNNEIRNLDSNRYEDFPELRRFSKNFKQIKIQEKSMKSYSSLTNRQSSKSVLSKIASTPHLPEINASNIKQNNKNVKLIVKKSTKSRLNNIYKSTENNLDNLESKSRSDYLVEMYEKKSSDLDLFHTESKINIQSSKKNHLKDQKTIVYNTILIQDVSEMANSNHQSAKKYHPTEKNKEKPLKTIQNIIDDIPSTLTRMASVGKVTNIEKIISNKLAEFYTFNNRVLN